MIILCGFIMTDNPLRITHYHLDNSYYRNCDCSHSKSLTEQQTEKSAVMNMDLCICIVLIMRSTHYHRHMAHKG